MTDKRLFIIETVSSHKIAYCIEAETQEEAEALIVCPTLEINEFGQEHIAENVFSVMQVDREGYIAMFDHLNSYITNVSEERKLSYIIKKA
jgi:hypothetical protein